MITLTAILTALVILMSWDAAEATDSQQVVPARTDDDQITPNNR